jgi:hypothetical protein
LLFRKRNRKRDLLQRRPADVYNHFSIDMSHNMEHSKIIAVAYACAVVVRLYACTGFDGESPFV